MPHFWVWGSGDGAYEPKIQNSGKILYNAPSRQLSSSHV